MLFSVCQFFVDGSYEYVRTNVDQAEAIRAFQHYSDCVGSRIGTTVRVIIVDMGDEIVAEWTKDKGTWTADMGTKE